jgi:NADPH:quinone reductase-like Zn-dependent oxidoreductase
MVATVVASAFGGPEVLAVIDQPVGEPGPAQVRLEVRAAGVNPVDYKGYSGLMGRNPGQLPMRLGLEAAGIVRAVGAGAEGPAGEISAGDEVVAFRIQGGYAAEVLVSASSVVPKPVELSFEEAGGLLLTGATAVHTLAATGVGAGDTVLIHGAAGGVGLMAVQLAANAGARVIGTASPGSHVYLRQLGAEPVTYGGDGLAQRVRALAPDGVTAAIDTVGSDEAIDTSVELVSDRRRIATVANPRRGFELGLKVLGGAPGADPGTEIRAAARLELVRLVAAGRLHVQVAGTYPLAEVAAAHRDLALGHTHGKIVLIP